MGRTITGTIALNDRFSGVMQRAGKEVKRFNRDIANAKKEIERRRKLEMTVQTRVLMNRFGITQALKAMRKSKYYQIAIEAIAKTQIAIRDIKKAAENIKNIFRKPVEIVLKAKDMASSVIRKINPYGMILGGGVVGGAVLKSFNVAGNMEQIRIAMKTLIKDSKGDITDAFIENMKTFAIQTPFEFTDLIKNTKYAMAMGFKYTDIKGLMTDVGDAVAGVGTGQAGLEGVVRALGQIRTKGKLSAQEMNQLAEQGIGAWGFVAKELGVTEAAAMKMGENGLIPAAKAIEAIRKGMRGQFGGMMEAQSKTMFGMLSTLKDFANLKIFGKFGEGMNKIISPALQGFINNLLQNESTMKRIEETAKKLGETFGGFLVSRFKAVAEIGKTVWKNFKQYVPIIQNTIIELQNTFKPAFNYIIDLVKRTVEMFKKNFPKIQNIIQNLWVIIKPILKILGISLMLILEIVLFIIPPILNFFNGLSQAIKPLSPIIETFMNAFVQIKKIITTIAPITAILIIAIKSIISFVLSYAFFLIKGIIGYISGFIGIIGVILSVVKNVVEIAVKTIITAIGFFKNGFLSFKNFITPILNIIGAAFNFLKEVGLLAFDILTAGIKKAVELLQPVFDFLKRMIDGIIGTFVSVSDAVKNILVSAFTKAQEVITGIWSKIKPIIDRVINFTGKNIEIVSIIKGSTNNIQDIRNKIKGHASGLSYVPRDNYPAMLHQGERVLTASENRNFNSGGGAINIAKLADTIIIREDADIDKIANALVMKLKKTRFNYGGA